jgi:crotonobetainyl-CoA:carnitine CoA-transferase CaiB-like acyl-CoA transferase
VIDVSLHEPLLALLGPLPALHGLTGAEAPRLGNRLPFSAPRGAYRSADGRWLGLSGSSPAAARRILRVIGGDALADDPRFATSAARLEHADELDALIVRWVGARTLEQALTALEAGQAAVAPVYRMADVFADPHIRARGTLERVPDDDLEELVMNGRGPAAVRDAGPDPLGRRRDGGVQRRRVRRPAGARAGRARASRCRRRRVSGRRRTPVRLTLGADGLLRPLSAPAR